MAENIRSPVKSWAQFDRKVRFSRQKLLGQLDKYHNPILVAGCQRSGTTALSRLITASKGMTNFQFGKDDELDAALLLSGWVKPNTVGRYCFQTTYLNDSYPEYFEHYNYKLIWVLRNPVSVVYSMLYNWNRSALNRLFKHCGVDFLDESEKGRFRRFGVISISRLRKACLSYVAKVSQIFSLHEKLGDEQLFISDYDKLVSNKELELKRIYQFIRLPYRKEYSDKLHYHNLNKVMEFHNRHQQILDSLCLPVYQKACTLLS